MKKLNLTYAEVVDLDAALEKAGAIKAKPDFSLKVAYNRQILKTHLKALEDARKMPEEMKKYDAARQDLVNEFGTVVQSGGQVMTQVRPECEKEFKDKLDPLLKKNKKVIDQYDKQMREFREEILPGPANFGEPICLHEFPQKILPAGLEGNLIFALIDLVKEPDKK
jgi:hypothetical protein